MILYLHYFNACTPVFYNVSMYLISNMILFSDDHGAAARDPQAVAGAGWRAGAGGGAGRLHQTRRSPAVSSVEQSEEMEMSVTQLACSVRGELMGQPVTASQI